MNNEIINLPNKSKKELVDYIPKKTSMEEIAKKVMKETDLVNLKKLNDLFKVTAAKKEMLRIIKLTEALDKIDDEAIHRLDVGFPIDNKELVIYKQALETSIDRSNKMLSEIQGLDLNLPVKSINLVQVNNIQLDLASREKIINLITNIKDKLDKKEKNIQEELQIIETDAVDNIILNNNDSEE